LPDERIHVRPGTESDLLAVAAIQILCPESAHWEAHEYLKYDLLVAESSGTLSGFVVVGPLPLGEGEILNLAVAPEWRRKGVARKLLEGVRKRYPGDLYLEVRESNQAAQKFYQSIGFQAVGRREGYYEFPPEAAIVMTFHSCYCHK
jgi:ribosomal-protein-alanine N-acetyltransferase